ncbi:MAG: MBL fold metallo-hydrolase [Deltaproteobacteria bacterium]
MNITILGSGGCTVIPRPLCRCGICNEARRKGTPYSRSGPSIFIHEAKLLVDTPAEICSQLNRWDIQSVKNLMLTHLDPDHLEGFRVVEQIALDFRTWKARQGLQIQLLLPLELIAPLRRVRTQYGSYLDFYETAGFIRCIPFESHLRINGFDITALPVDRQDQTAFIYVFEKEGIRMVYAPCDIKPFPEHRPEIYDADCLIIQPGMFETDLADGFSFPGDHVSRSTLYTFTETLALAQRIHAGQVVFVHLEEYWNRSYDDYTALEQKMRQVRFAFDGMKFNLNPKP